MLVDTIQVLLKFRGIFLEGKKTIHSVTNQKIAILGGLGSFHEMAARKSFGNQVELLPCLNFEDICKQLKNQQATHAVMAIENVIAGALLQNYALLEQYDFTVYGETYVPIALHLMALPGVSLQAIEEAHSHPIAHQQCQAFFQNFPTIKRIDRPDTALSAKAISVKKSTTHAAIASEAAAQLYGLEILQANVQSAKENYTRFLVLSNDASTLKDANKASIRFELQHHPELIAEVLVILHQHDLKLTNFQVITPDDRAETVAFYADLEWAVYENFLKGMQQLEGFVLALKCLGEYQKQPVPFASENLS